MLFDEVSAPTVQFYLFIFHACLVLFNVAVPNGEEKGSLT